MLCSCAVVAWRNAGETTDSIASSNLLIVCSCQGEVFFLMSFECLDVDIKYGDFQGLGLSYAIVCCQVKPRIKIEKEEASEK